MRLVFLEWRRSNMSVKELSKRSGINRTTVMRALYGEAEPSARIAHSLAIALGMKNIKFDVVSENGHLSPNPESPSSPAPE